MEIVIAAACVLACAFSLDAQITTTLNHLPDGSEEVKIRNNSATSLVASVALQTKSIAAEARAYDDRIALNAPCTESV